MNLSKEKTKESLFQLSLCIILGLFCVITLYPFLNILAKSLSVGTAMIGKDVTIFPIGFTFENYNAIFISDMLTNAMIISILRTLIGSLAHLIVVGLAAYGASKVYLKGRKFIILFFLIPMYFSGGLVPTYMLITTLKLTNNFLVYILPGMFSTFNFLLMLTYFKQIPNTYEEAARIDGASDLTILLKIMIPLSAPIIATVALFVAVGQWNSWFDALLYVTRQKLFPIQMVLQNILKSTQGEAIMQQAKYGMTSHRDVTITSESIKMATLCFAIFPIVIVYPFLQKYFVKGIMIGGIKG